MSEVATFSLLLPPSEKNKNTKTIMEVEDMMQQMNQRKEGKKKKKQQLKFCRELESMKRN